MQLDIADLLGIAALVLNLLLITKIIFQPASDRIGKSLLLALLVALGVMILNHLYALTQLYLRYPQFLGSFLVFRYLIGPMLYWYVLRTTSGLAPWDQRRWILHWLLPVVVVLYLLPFYSLSGQEKLAYLQTPPSFTRQVINLGHYLQILVYIYICLPMLRQYQQKIINNFADIGRINLKWLNRVCVGLVVIILVDFMLPWFGIVSALLYHTFLTMSAIFIIVVAYSALGHSQLEFATLADGEPDAATSKNESDSKSKSEDSEKYSRSGLRADTAQYYLKKLERLMTTEQCFLEDNLSLKSLATRLNMSSHHLSQLLNDQLRCTFYDYINNLRVRYACDLLLEKLELPVIEVAYAAGYTNKGTFYTAFKRRTGMTPSRYRLEQSQSGEIKKEVGLH